MIKVYKKLDGTIVNPITHTREIFLTEPNAILYIGTDSQNHRRKTVYATVIAYRYDHRGVHYITQKHVVPKIKNMFDRLLKETELSIDCAEMLSSAGLKSFIKSIDMDFNSDDKWESNRLINASVGWAKGMGYNVRVKYPRELVKDEDVLIATKAADHQVRHLSSKEEKKANRRLKRKKKRLKNKK